MEILQSVVTIVLFFLILGTLVVVHELGHFVTARLANVRVLEFGIGFPPRAKVIRSSGETLYTLNWLPIGGFVKLEGEDGDDTDDPRSFVNARLPVRLVILIAGVGMNLLLALAIFLLIAMLATPLYGLRFPQVEPGSPAERAGFQPGDSIISINGKSYEMFGRYVDQSDPITDLRARAGETIVLGVHRADGRIEELTVTLRPRSEVTDMRGPLGVGPRCANGPCAQGEVPTEPVLLDYYGQYTGHDPGTAARIAVEETGAWFGLIIEGLRNVVGSFVTNPTEGPVGVTGPIGIAQQIGQAFWSFGPIITLYVAGILSANLALVNALPFPPLDGGRILMIILKALFGRRISVQAERVTYFVGFVFLMAFLVWVTWFDIIRGGAT